MTDRSRRREETRARLVGAAVEVFAAQGITASTVEQVCDRAGFTRGAFYSNFESKNDLCREILDVETQFYGEAFAKGAADFAGHFSAFPADLRRDPYEVLELGLRQLLPAFIAGADDRAASHTMVSLLFTELGLYAAREAGIRAAYQRYAEAILDPIEQLFGPLLGLAGLELRMDSTSAAEIVHSLWESGSRQALLLASSPSQLVDVVAEHVMVGLRLVTLVIGSGA